MKRAFNSRIACGQAMLEELQRKFPATDFELSYFDPDSWDTFTAEGMRQMMDNRMKYGQTLGEIKKCVCIVWENGASESEVKEISDKYLQKSVIRMGDEFRRVPNVGFDEDGKPVQMGLFKEIFLERSISNEAFEKLTAGLSDRKYWDLDPTILRIDDNPTSGK